MIRLLCRVDFRSCMHQMPHVYVTDTIADNFDHDFGEKISAKLL